MIDFNDKKRIVESGLDKLERRLRFMQFDNKSSFDSYDKYFQEFGNDFKLAIKLNNSYFAKKTRLSKYISYLLFNYDCTFLTLTFNNKTENKTDYLTRRKYVNNFLNSQNVLYIANIDFGGLNNREHYHAIVNSQNIDYSAWHKFGSIKGLKCGNSSSDIQRLSKYVIKLSSHAIKDSTGNNRIMYCRKLSKIMKNFEKTEKNITDFVISKNKKIK